jgi:DNA-directed RNA polymerase specialized sigma subunit
VFPVGLDRNTLPDDMSPLRDLDQCVQTVVDWIYKNQTARSDYKQLRSQNERKNEIMKRYQSGETMTAIAKDYGITAERVSQIIKNTTNNHA